MSTSFKKLTDAEKKQLVKLNAKAGVKINKLKGYVEEITCAEVELSDDIIMGRISKVTHLDLDVNGNHRIKVRYRGEGSPFWNINTQQLDYGREVIIPSLLSFLNRLGVIITGGEPLEVLASISVDDMSQILTQLERVECDIESYLSNGHIINDLRPFYNKDVAMRIKALITELADV